MAGPNMAAITASLERSLQNCSLNQTRTTSGGSSTGGGVGFSSSSDSTENQQSHSSDAALDLNSQISLPYNWEQCLDLKVTRKVEIPQLTGEIYYINWRTGMKAKEDPRSNPEELFSGDFYSDDDSSYESEGSSSESSPSSSNHQQQKEQYNHHQQQQQHPGDNEEQQQRKGQVLVVAGCKGCLMYFMVPKQVGVCPKCCGQLLHFDRSESE